MDRGPRAPVSVFDDPTPEPFAGTVRGTRFTAAEARALLFPTAPRAREGSTAGALVIVLRAHACPAEGGGGGGAHVVLSLSSRPGARAAAIAAGRYDVRAGEAPAAGLDAAALLVDPGGPGPAIAPASGWIEIEAIDGARVTGAAVLDFGDGGLLSGWFVAPRTVRLARA
ncbi:hypothetical protein [Anaeromyxobacter oryzae]|uniref:Uncharacterized protein n=1 Tax=Anaeromyxobacter oryzae TaxID=2918170 RepID=A0ABM7X3J4_9BACT|nr:hypothetical protein [Anaeromyxobacter oryzae]BDG06363.1 hypothetical protein AMOR_53590 [Anaeromyxobacter oryzae]